MDEYIKREDAIKMIENDLPEVVYYRKEDAIACLECIPTADVAPKSEVAREICRNIYAAIFEMMPLKVFRLINGDYVEKSFESGRERALHDVLNYIFELEKKYTGERHESYNGNEV